MSGTSSKSTYINKGNQTVNNYNFNFKFQIQIGSKGNLKGFTSLLSNFTANQWAFLTYLSNPALATLLFDYSEKIYKKYLMFNSLLL